MLNLRDDANKKSQKTRKLINYNQNLLHVLSLNPEFKVLIDKFQNWLKNLLNNECDNVSLHDMFLSLRTEDTMQKSIAQTKIVDRILRKEIENFEDELIDKKLLNFSWDLCVWYFDIVNSKNDINYKKSLALILFAVNFFESIFKEEGFLMIWSEWDSVYIWLFNQKNKTYTNILIFNLFLSMCKDLWVNLHSNIDLLTLKEWDFQLLKTSEFLWLNLISNNFSNSISKTQELRKDWWFSKILSDSVLSRIKHPWAFKNLNLWPESVLNVLETQDTLNYLDFLDQFFDSKSNDLMLSLKNFYLNNFSIGDFAWRQISSKHQLQENSNKCEILELMEDVRIISLWDASEDVNFYILLDWSLEVSNMINSEDKITLNRSYEFVWEMSLEGSISCADVLWRSGAKLIKIPKSHMRQAIWIDLAWDRKATMDPDFRETLKNIILQASRERKNRNIELRKFNQKDLN